MLSRATLLRRAAALSRRATPQRHFAEQAVALDGSKLKFNFFLPHDAIKSNAEVVRRARSSDPRFFFSFRVDAVLTPSIAYGLLARV